MKILTLLLLISLMGCGSKQLPPQTVYVTQEVEVPIYQVPKFDIPTKPMIPVEALNWSHIDDHNVIGKSYVTTVEILKADAQKLRNLLEGIKKGEDQ